MRILSTYLSVALLTCSNILPGCHQLQPDERPDCHTSLYGCCQDGKTPASGSNYKGCPSFDRCSLEPDTGSCDGKISSYFYNASSERCEELSYTGCGGNENRFDSLAECNRACTAGELTDTQDRVSVDAGSQVQLSCQIPKQDHSIRWRFIPAISSIDNQPRELTGDISEVLDTDISVLTIKSIRLEDSGSYICETVVTDTGDEESTQVEIDVREKTEFDETTSFIPIKFDSTPFFTTVAPAIGDGLEGGLDDGDSGSGATDALPVVNRPGGVSSTTLKITTQQPTLPELYTQPECRSTRYGCCEDGTTEALGPNGEGCIEVTTPSGVEKADTTTISVVTTTKITTTKTAAKVTSSPAIEYKTSTIPKEFNIDNSSENEAIEKESKNKLTTSLGVTVTQDPSMTFTTPLADVIYLTTVGITEESPPPPPNFKVERKIVAPDRISIDLSWDVPVTVQPIDSYIIRFTEDHADRDLRFWRKFSTEATSYELALKKGYIYYFQISGLLQNGKHTKLSPIYSYNPEELTSRLYCEGGQCLMEKPCENTRYGCCKDGETAATGPNQIGCPTSEPACATHKWGCCSDGMSSAAGPNRLGCAGDPQPCDISQFGCCPNGKNEAKGFEFEGCPQNEVMRNMSGMECKISTFGCCGDGITRARGPNKDGCPDLKALGDSCKLPSETGSCLNYTVNWFYDVTSGTCRRFWYGGCEGNTNRFGSKEHCESVCVRPPGTAACYLPAVSGGCRSTVSRWHYDHSTESCQTFDYGGCGGNTNNFRSNEDCQNFCQPAAAHTDVCSQPKVVGGCQGEFTRWWYDRRSGECKEFSYSGCQGNENRFATPDDCYNQCGAQRDQKDLCLLPKIRGRCHAPRSRWYFDSTFGRCLRFMYSGCGANSNNFLTYESCVRKCDGIKLFPEDPCTLAKHVGNCLAMIPSWFYDDSQGTCVQFLYSGCGGNKNRFSTQEKCKTQCSHRAEMSVKELCSLPPNSGDGVGNDMRWAFDPSTKSCTQFEYSGTGGNRNRFVSEEECSKVCSRGSTGLFDPGNCVKPTVAGSCIDTLVRYSYDHQKGICKPFVYSGCGGNENNFESQQECETNCSPKYEDGDRQLCKLPAESGPCTKSVLRWAFDTASGSCVQFSYGGCLGNRNNFLSEADCLNGCQMEKTLPVDVCLANADPGDCSGSIPMYYYNSASSQCELFYFTGCAGNGNRFETKDKCEMRCSHRATANNLGDVCSLTQDSGPCEGSYPRWFYNKETRSCEQFSYGGCRGNGNNFATSEECENRCDQSKTKDICKLPSEPGICLAYIRKWFYNSEEGLCQQFIYGGCGGNKNRFISEKACQERCMDVKDNDESTQTTDLRHLDKCSQEADTGAICANNEEPRGWKWFYDRREGSCQHFAYNGCEGNENKFDTKEDCEQECPVKEICSLPEEYGKCDEQQEMYRYDQQLSKCVLFTYSGCEGNANRFETRAMCEVTCQRYMASSPLVFETKQITSTPVQQGVVSPCSQAVMKGSCSEEMLSYFFDPSAGVCKEFIYSGCGGNDNRFSSIVECTDTCMNNRVAEPTTDKTQNTSCEELICPETCIDGFIVDENGCQTCDCINPCAGIICQDGTHCKVERKICDKFNVDCIPAQVGCIPVDQGDSNSTTDTDEDCNKAQYGCCLGSRVPSEGPQFYGCPELAPYIIRPKGLGSQFVRNVGMSVNLPCNAFGVPIPKIVWYKNRSPLAITKQGRLTLGEDNSLNIENIQNEDRGEYVCRAFNDVGDPAFEHLTLTVHQGVLIKDGPVKFTSMRGDNVTIPCNVVGNPKPEIVWIFEGEVLSTDNKYYIGDDNSIAVYDVDPSDMGDYICIGRNEINSASKTFVLTIKEPLKVVMESHFKTYKEKETLKLSCKTEGFPIAKIEWMRNDESLPYEDRVTIDGHTLEVRELKKSDSGYYTCIAANEYEVQSATTTINVYAAAPVLPASCQDKPHLANCALIVKYNYCGHPIYRTFCCNSCVTSGRLRLK